MELIIEGFCSGHYLLIAFCLPVLKPEMLCSGLHSVDGAHPQTTAPVWNSDISLRKEPAFPISDCICGLLCGDAAAV